MPAPRRFSRPSPSPDCRFSLAPCVPPCVGQLRRRISRKSAEFRRASACEDYDGCGFGAACGGACCGDAPAGSDAYRRVRAGSGGAFSFVFTGKDGKSERLQVTARSAGGSPAEAARIARLLYVKVSEQGWPKQQALLYREALYIKCKRSLSPTNTVPSKRRRRVSAPACAGHATGRADVTSQGDNGIKTHAPACISVDVIHPAASPDGNITTDEAASLQLFSLRIQAETRASAHYEALDAPLRHPGVLKVTPVSSDQVNRWLIVIEVTTSFGPESSLVELTRATTQVHLALHLPCGFPLDPPMVRVMSPRLSGDHVTAHGIVWIESLTPQGWDPATSFTEVGAIVCGAFQEGLLVVAPQDSRKAITYSDDGALREHAWLVDRVGGETQEARRDSQEVADIKRALVAARYTADIIRGTQQMSCRLALRATSSCTRVRMAICSAEGVGDNTLDDLHGIVGPGAGALAGRTASSCDRVFSMMMRSGPALHIRLESSRECRILMRVLEEVLRLPVLDAFMF